MCVDAVADNGPGRYCSPRSGMPCKSRNEGSGCESMTWRAVSGRPYLMANPGSVGYRLDMMMKFFTQEVEVKLAEAEFELGVAADEAAVKRAVAAANAAVRAQVRTRPAATKATLLAHFNIFLKVGPGRYCSPRDATHYFIPCFLS